MIVCKECYRNVKNFGLFLISWIAVYSNGKTEYYNDKIAIDYEYPDEIVAKAEEYINEDYFLC